MLEYIAQCVIVAFKPVYNLLMDGSSRYYWVYIIFGLAIAWFAYGSRGRNREFLARLFDKNVWWSVSSQNDYRIIMINPVLMFSVLSWATVNYDTISTFTANTLQSAGVTGAAGTEWAWAWGFALTATLFIVNDFMRWWLHYLAHKIPLLWEFHKIHHSAEVLNFATAERFHPVDALSFAACSTAAVAMVNGAFIAFAGDHLTVSTIAGANAVWAATNYIGGVLRHSQFWISFGPRVERWLVSPAMHHIHHSDDPKHYDTNMGGALAIWDRMFGTINYADETVKQFGIGEETKEFRSLSGIYFRPFVSAYRLFVPESKQTDAAKAA